MDAKGVAGADLVSDDATVAKRNSGRPGLRKCALERRQGIAPQRRKGFCVQPGNGGQVIHFHVADENPSGSRMLIKRTAVVFKQDDPLLFDEQYAVKPAFVGVLDAFLRR